MRNDQSGRGQGRGGGRGRNQGGGYSIGGNCICTSCGTKVAHQRGIPCTQMKCPKCGKTMLREELWQERGK